MIVAKYKHYGNININEKNSKFIYLYNYLLIFIHTFSASNEK